MKTNKQIADECAVAAWSWLCLQYDIPIPRIQQIIKEFYDETIEVAMPPYRVSLTRQRPLFVPPIPGSSPGEVIAAANNLQWLSGCRTNNRFESWTLQFVDGFTRIIEFQRKAGGSVSMGDIQFRAMLNQVDFAKDFFPHLHRKYRQRLTQLLRVAKTEMRRARISGSKSRLLSVHV